MFKELVAINATARDCNPETIFQSRDFGIEKRQSKIPGLVPGLGDPRIPGLPVLDVGR